MGQQFIGPGREVSKAKLSGGSSCRCSDREPAGAAFLNLAPVNFDLDSVGGLGGGEFNMTYDQGLRHQRDGYFLRCRIQLPILCWKKARFARRQRVQVYSTVSRSDKTGRTGVSSLATLVWRNCEFKMTLTVCHGREAVVLGGYQRACDRFMRHTIHDDAANIIAISTLRILCVRLLAAYAT